MAVLEALSEEEKLLLAILQDPSGIDIAEFLWKDPDSKNKAGKKDQLFRCWSYQYPWYRNDEKKQIDQCGRAIGKALSLDTLVPTPGGFTTMGDLSVGDVIYGSDGNPTTVINAFDVLDNRPCYEVEFDDGTVIIADENHLWTTWNKRERVSGRDRRLQRSPQVRTTAEIADTLMTKTKHPERNHSIEIAKPIVGQEKDLPLHPYLLGYWLGDGNSRNGHITIGEQDREETVARLNSCGVELTETATRGHFAVHFPGVHNHKTSSVTATLRSLGVLENKHIPVLYARASVTQRIELLRGLMDSDGHITKISHCENTQVNERLAEDLLELCCSLGLKAFMEKRRAMLNGIDYGPAYRLGFTPRGFNPFHLTRKAIRVAAPKSDRISGHRRITAVRPVPSVPVRCITVDAEDSLFLVGRTMLPTHNSVGIQMRAYAFPFCNPGQDMLITAPEMIHLDPVTKVIEDRLMGTRLSREMLRTQNQSNGITHRPFEAKFRNNAKIVGRIPQKDGKGVKGMHPRILEMDEAQDYPGPGWIELTETLRYGDEGSRWRAHGVSRGVRDHYYKLTQSNDWMTHRYTAMHRPDWTAEERVAKAEFYGSRDHPDYRRNILGLHGDSMSALFVLHRLMACVDSNPNSDFNENEYYHLRLNDERVRDSGIDIADHVNIPGSHKIYKRFWAGMDVGMTNHPTEILVWAEENLNPKGKDSPTVRLKCIARFHLERISAPDQIKVMEAICDFYKPQGFGMDRTGLGLPIFQYCLDKNLATPNLYNSIRGYNFSEKIPVSFKELEDNDEWVDPIDRAIMANVLEYSSDQLRLLVDQGRLKLPWDIDMLKEFQGQAYYTAKSSTNPYGKKEFNKGKFHALDAARMAALAYVQSPIEELLDKKEEYDSVMLTWLEDDGGYGNSYGDAMSF